MLWTAIFRSLLLARITDLRRCWPNPLETQAQHEINMSDKNRAGSRQLGCSSLFHATLASLPTSYRIVFPRSRCVHPFSLPCQIKITIYYPIQFSDTRECTTSSDRMYVCLVKFQYVVLTFPTTIHPCTIIRIRIYCLNEQNNSECPRIATAPQVFELNDLSLLKTLV